MKKSGVDLRIHGLKHMLILDLSTQRHPECEDIGAENSLQVLYFSSIPFIDLNICKSTASMERYCDLHSKKGITQLLLVFIPSRVVKLVVMKQV